MLVCHFNLHGSVPVFITFYESRLILQEHVRPRHDATKIRIVGGCHSAPAAPNHCTGVCFIPAIKTLFFSTNTPVPVSMTIALSTTDIQLHYTRRSQEPDMQKDALLRCGRELAGRISSRSTNTKRPRLLGKNDLKTSVSIRKPYRRLFSTLGAFLAYLLQNDYFAVPERGVKPIRNISSL
jgi:hypothetical protein